MSSNSEATIIAQISSQPDLDSPSLSDFKSTPRSAPTTIHTSTPEKSNSSHSSHTPTQDQPPVEPKIKPPPTLITSTSVWKKAVTKLQQFLSTR